MSNFNFYFLLKKIPNLSKNKTLIRSDKKKHFDSLTKNGCLNTNGIFIFVLKFCSELLN